MTRRKSRQRKRKPGESAKRIGDQFKSFAAIGLGLYAFSSMAKVQFEKFLFVVFIVGTLLTVIKEGYNPGWSDSIDHKLSAEQIEVIRSFIESRNELQSNRDEKKQQAINKLHRMSSSHLNHLID